MPSKQISKPVVFGVKERLISNKHSKHLPRPFLYRLYKDGLQLVNVYPFYVEGIDNGIDKLKYSISRAFKVAP